MKLSFGSFVKEILLILDLDDIVEIERKGLGKEMKQTVGSKWSKLQQQQQSPARFSYQNANAAAHPHPLPLIMPPDRHLLFVPGLDSTNQICPDEGRRTVWMPGVFSSAN